MNALTEARRANRNTERVQIKEATETRTILFEWPLTNLKSHFDSSKSDAKSKVIKSVPFGGGRWTVLFYAQSGIDQFCSLYLNAEPSQEERNQAVEYRGPSTPGESGAVKEDKWAREGLYGFTFQIQTIDRATILGTKEAHDHAFSDKTSNWGWAQFAKRDAVYYSNSAVRAADAFLISVSVTDSPERPRIQRSLGHTVPPVLVQAMGSLLDDPDHSDIVFVIHPRRRTPNGNRRPKQKVYAIKKILAARCEYFRDMFEGGFLEAETVGTSDDDDSVASPRSSPSNDRQQSPLRGGVGTRASPASGARQDGNDFDDDLDDDQSDAILDDSDEELEYLESRKLDLAAGRDQYLGRKSGIAGGAHNASTEEGCGRHGDNDDDDDDFVDDDEVIAVSGGGGGGGGGGADPGDAMATMGDQDQIEEYMDTSSSFPAFHPGSPIQPLSAGAASFSVKAEPGSEGVPQRQLSGGRTQPMDKLDASGSSADRAMVRQNSVGQNTRPEIRTPQKPQPTQKRSRANTFETHDSKKVGSSFASQKKRRKVVVRDSAYLTFKALLYYLYTDTVEFSPLTSSFLSTEAAAEESSSGSGVCMANGDVRWGSSSTDVFNDEMRKAHAMRKEHIDMWCARFPDKPVPCSAKAMYRLADKLQITDLKRRAQEHIANSLTVKNIVWEVFSGFNTQFKDIRKIETDYLLKHWKEVKKSRAMKTIFFRSSAHPGLAEVWPYLLSQLEYKATPDEGAIEASDSE
ncbi:uncharacterized protein PFL1_06495 [Pseudozyma flocculosa PF-1]|uniref:MATH domain-containing protein n=1 Tax=Pseudozyma flocculosa PF-1 TaxID=1277687 RepID=A0A061H0W6_9BASI|nr:uncharacterized protein PFL1_06495 [Pseudozyma flocculosa PF-1]EPQ26042.1 hypothetical protein PFL1_06495 [Pseudozyma flocculosa PF-1]